MIYMLSSTVLLQIEAIWLVNLNLDYSPFLLGNLFLQFCNPQNICFSILKFMSFPHFLSSVNSIAAVIIVYSHNITHPEKSFNILHMDSLSIPVFLRLVNFKMYVLFFESSRVKLNRHSHSSNLAGWFVPICQLGILYHIKSNQFPLFCNAFWEF